MYLKFLLICIFLYLSGNNLIKLSLLFHLFIIFSYLLINSRLLVLLLISSPLFYYILLFLYCQFINSALSGNNFLCDSGISPFLIRYSNKRFYAFLLYLLLLFPFGYGSSCHKHFKFLSNIIKYLCFLLRGLHSPFKPLIFPR